MHLVGAPSYVVKDSMVNFDTIDKLTLYIEKLYINTFNAIAEGSLYIGVTEDMTSNSFVKEQHISWNFTEPASTDGSSQTIILDTSDIQGNYYIKVLANPTVGSTFINNFSTVTITGE